MSPPRAAAAVDPDDVGAQVGQEHAAERPRSQPGELDDPYALQRSHRRSSEARGRRRATLLGACCPTPTRERTGGPGADGLPAGRARRCAGCAGPLGAVGGAPDSPGGWPWATLLVNLTGCFLLGVLLGGRSAAAPPSRPGSRPFLGVGVLGGYTTYSTFAVEVVRPGGRRRASALAAGYVLVSVVGGVAAVAAGAAHRAAGGPVTPLLVVAGRARRRAAAAAGHPDRRPGRPGPRPGHAGGQRRRQRAAGRACSASAAVPGWVVALVGTGFCGTLTTFSTFGADVVRLVEERALGRALAYLAGTLVLGLGSRGGRTTCCPDRLGSGMGDNSEDHVGADSPVVVVANRLPVDQVIGPDGEHALAAQPRRAGDGAGALRGRPRRRLGGLVRVGR